MVLASAFSKLKIDWVDGIPNHEVGGLSVRHDSPLSKADSCHAFSFCPKPEKPG